MSSWFGALLKRFRPWREEEDKEEDPEPARKKARTENITVASVNSTDNEEENPEDCEVKTSTEDERPVEGPESDQTRDDASADEHVAGIPDVDDSKDPGESEPADEMPKDSQGSGEDGIRGSVAVVDGEVSPTSVKPAKQDISDVARAESSAGKQPVIPTASMVSPTAVVPPAPMPNLQIPLQMQLQMAIQREMEMQRQMEMIAMMNNNPLALMHHQMMQQLALQQQQQQMMMVGMPSGTMGLQDPATMTGYSSTDPRRQPGETFEAFRHRLSARAAPLDWTHDTTPFL